MKIVTKGSLQAKRIIAQAIEKKEVRIDLGHKRLRDIETQVPELFDFVKLKELILSDMWQYWCPYSHSIRLAGYFDNRSYNRLNKLPQKMQLLNNLSVFICGGLLDRWGISDLSPLAYLVNLRILSLEGNKISDLSPLSGLGNLKVLHLSGNKISDLSPLSGLDGVTHLHLNNNKISDLSPLSGLKGLTHLFLNNNDICDLSPLSGLKGLTHLHLNNNKISDLSPLSGNNDCTRII